MKNDRRLILKSSRQNIECIARVLLDHMSRYRCYISFPYMLINIRIDTIKSEMLFSHYYTEIQTATSYKQRQSVCFIARFESSHMASFVAHYFLTNV